jgi:hypothetical protein
MMAAHASRHGGRTRRIVAAALGVWLAAQVAQSVTGRNTWPFSGYDMFSELASGELWTWRAALREADGGEREVELERLFPVEFFRAPGMATRLFLGPETAAAKAEAAERLLRRLDEAPWGAFDEVAAAPRARIGSAGFVGFVGLRLDAVRLELGRGADGRELERRPLFDYRRGR